jgi:hypothetical protein
MVSRSISALPHEVAPRPPFQQTALRARRDASPRPPVTDSRQLSLDLLGVGR